MKKVFISGNKALAEGAIYAGCRYYYGVPRIINNEILKYMSVRMPEVNGVFVQAENERSAAGMLMGSAAAGANVLISSITEGISAMDDVLNHLCGYELPCVIANIMSGRFGLNSLEPTQSGYTHAVKSSMSGNRKFIVFAPHTVQEVYDLTIKAFELSVKYRNPVMILMDSGIAQLMEGLEIENNLLPPATPDKNWVLNGAKDRDPSIYKIYHDDNSETYKNIFNKFNKMKDEILYENFMTEDADEIIVAFGLVAKIAKGIILEERKKGKKIGLFRPISLSPFPKDALREVTDKVKSITVLEANSGDMYSDICEILDNNKKVKLFGESEDLIGFRKLISEFEKGLSLV